MRLDRDFVVRYSQRYLDLMGDRERIEEERLLGEVGPRTREQGHYTRTDLTAVARWKTRRSQSRVARNDEADVRDVSRLAFLAPEHFQHRVLTLLHGIQVPTATALLAIWAPTVHTVMDVRSCGALTAFGEMDDADPSYPAYLALCRALAQRTGSDLRSLDRALWRWDKDGRPSR